MGLDMADSKIVVSVSIKDGKLKKLLKDVREASKATIAVGVLGNPEVATYASYNEFGWVQRVTPKQAHFLNKTYGLTLNPGYTLMSPPRPFLRSTARDSAKDWANTLGKGIRVLGPEKIEEALLLVGRQAQVDVQKTIKNAGTDKEKFPLRSPMTMQIYQVKDAETAKGNKRNIERGSGSARPQALFKTGVLLGAIGYELRK